MRIPGTGVTPADISTVIMSKVRLLSYSTYAMIYDIFVSVFSPTSIQSFSKERYGSYILSLKEPRPSN